MPRINQLPSAASVAQTDVLAIDTPDKTYQVPRSVLAPAPFVVAITTGQWSGSGSDYYITVTANNVTADAMLYPFYDNASAALLNGPVWCIPSAGSFTIHTSAIPSGTVIISVLFAGILGEAQYQVLADVYSKSQVDSIVAQSTAYSTNALTTDTSVATSAGLRIFRYGRLRIITGGIIPAVSQGTWLVLCTLAATDRPTAQVSAPVSGYGATSVAEMVLRTNGELCVNLKAGTSTTGDIKVNMSYIAA